MTYVISFINSKGGTGKTTLAFSLATYWDRLGKHVLLIDCDPQASLVTLFGVRENKGNMEAMPVDIARLESRLKAEIASNAHDIIIIDTPGNLASLRPAVTAADVVAIPIQASGTDYFAFKRAYNLCEKHSADVIVVPNRIKTSRDTATVTPTLVALTEGKATIAPIVTDRVDHRAHTVDGLSIVDVEEKGAGALEIQSLAICMEEKLDGTTKHAAGY